MKRIGILAIQGDIAEHARSLDAANAMAVPVRRIDDLDGLDGLILPGGESTTIGLLAGESSLLSGLRDYVKADRPTWGTCAGVILLADRVIGAETVIGGLDITVQRNAFGRQVDSFEADVLLDVLGESPFRGVFIRAPGVVEAGPGVEVLARIDPGGIVAMRSGRVMGTVFHPELTDDTRLASLFLDSVPEV